MIYLTGDATIIVLETGNLEELKKGHPAETPDGKILIAWTPDPVWLADKLMDSGGDPMKIAVAIAEASRRPQKEIDRPYHKPHYTQFEN